MELSGRWKTPEGRRVVDEVVSRLRRGRSLDKLGLGEVDGRVDLRGLPWPVPEIRSQRSGRKVFGIAQGSGFPEVRGAKLTGIDFGGAALPHLRLFDSTVADCVFTGAAMKDFRAWGTSFEHCDLSRADLREGLVGSWHEGKGNAWRQCRFDSARMDKAVMLGAVFEECRFHDVSLADAAVQFSGFRDVVFSGPLSEVAFYGFPFKSEHPPRPFFENVDFSAARLQNVMFVGFRLDGARFPEDADIAVLPDAQRRLERALAALRGEQSDEAHYLTVVIESTVKMYGPDADLFVNYADLARDCGARGAELMRRLVNS
ncbi:pentapeptide repeat-containing protein [Streptomyces sp. NPDC051940]|uniref:pentapeptide repeat-containing protein n=1 Tax=Streptomyces sp. NPDC051940 TaxID=3155675 RepID=UPI003430C0D8